MKTGDIRFLASTSFLLVKKNWSSEIRLHAFKMLQVHADIPLPCLCHGSRPSKLCNLILMGLILCFRMLSLMSDSSYVRIICKISNMLLNMSFQLHCYKAWRKPFKALSLVGGDSSIFLQCGCGRNRYH